MCTGNSYKAHTLLSPTKNTIHWSCVSFRLSPKNKFVKPAWDTVRRKILCLFSDETPGCKDMGGCSSVSSPTVRPLPYRLPACPHERCHLDRRDDPRFVAIFSILHTAHLDSLSRRPVFSCLPGSAGRNNFLIFRSPSSSSFPLDRHCPCRSRNSQTEDREY